MQHFVSNLMSETPYSFTFTIIVTSTICFGIAYQIYVVYTNYKLEDKANLVEATRIHEGLPNDVTLTAEDFAQNPELRGILGITDTDNTVNVTLETNERLEHTKFQVVVDGANNFMDAIGDFISNFIG
jgi:hypothetical protein